MPILDVRGVQIHYSVKGSGPTLVLVAGLAQTRSFWDRIGPYLKEFQLVSFDSRGVGESSATKSLLSVELLVDDVRALVEELGLSTFFIAGHSLGAAVAFELAQRCSDKVSKLLMISGMYPGPWFVPSGLDALKSMMSLYSHRRELIEEGLRLATSAQFPLVQSEVFQGLVEQCLKRKHFDSSVYMNQIQAGIRYLQRDHLLGGLDVPLCLVYGEEDRIVHPDNGYRIRFRVPGTHLHCIPHCGHLVPLECPKRLADIIRGFCLTTEGWKGNNSWRQWFRGFIGFFIIFLV